jgi:hypothetical protein
MPIPGFKKHHHFSTFFILIFTLPFSACNDQVTDAPKDNQPPETHLFLQPDSELATSTSRQILHWWGDDADGRVSGFVYTFDSKAPEITEWEMGASDPFWTFTESNQDTFSLRFAGTDTMFVFRVKAVDDEGAADPTSASQRFPVQNSPPVVNFVPGTEIPDTTLTVATFTWIGADLDGDNTIARYEYVLDNPNANWQQLPATTTNLILRQDDGLTPGRHIFYLRVIDIAGTSSPIVRMPASGDGWVVIPPEGRYVVVDDFFGEPAAATFYRAVLDTVVGAYSVMRIKDKPAPLSVLFQETLFLFERVIWYADSQPNLELAGIVLPAFTARGGKVIFSTLFTQFFSQQGDPLAFSPVDSVNLIVTNDSPPREVTRILNNRQLLPTNSRPTFETLRISSVVTFVKEVVPKPTATALYRLQPSTEWRGQPVLAVEDATHSFVFFSIPLHRLDGDRNAGAMIRRILVEVFGGI